MFNHRISWLSQAHSGQLPPDAAIDYFIWLLLAGRAYGKNRSGGEESLWKGSKQPGVRIAIIAPTHHDLRECFEGECGLLRLMPASVQKHEKFAYNRALFQMTLPNGSTFEGYSSEAPERLRGPQFHAMWWVEPGLWKNAELVAEQANFCMRLKKDSLGNDVHPVVFAQAFPRPTPLLKKIMHDHKTVISTGSSLENAPNLSSAMIYRINQAIDDPAQKDDFVVDPAIGEKS